MKHFLKDIVDFDKSIINNYITHYKYPWEFLDDLSNIIIEIGKKLDSKNFSEVYKNVWINKTAVVDPTVKIIGPCIIDKDAIIKVNAYIRENVIIGKKCIVGNSSEVKNSILFDEAKIPHFNYIGDSILGYRAHFGAGSIISNVKSDESFVKTKINGKLYDTKRKKYGSLVGDNVEIGCNAVLVPGVFINSNSIIYPLVMVRGEIDKNKIVKDMNNIVNREFVKIYIDFDSTLFDTDKFYLDFLTLCKKKGIEKENIDLYKKMMFNDTNLFNLENVITFLKTKDMINDSFDEELKELYLNNYVYEDVIPVLEKLDKKYELILLTYGNYDYQMKKIESSTLKKYFKEIIITDKNKAELDNVDYKNSIFIDNNPVEVEKFYQKNAKKVIRIRRKDDKKSKIETGIDVPEYVDFYQIYDKELV